MKKVIIKVLLILLIILEGIYLIIPNNKLNNKIEQVSYENNDINNKSTLAYYIDDVPQENRNTWPTDSPNIAYLKSKCYDENNSPVEASQVVTFNNESHTAQIKTKKTVYCSLYFVSLISLNEIVEKSEESGTLETLAALATRNEEITNDGGTVLDDLRRFIGTKDTVTNNFICFGTNDKDTCLENMDSYMYRIIGIDTNNRLKLIKATILGSFAWKPDADWEDMISWNGSSVYNGLNSSSNSYYPKMFIGNDKYKYMQDSNWTNLILTTTYYIGTAPSTTALKSFQEERKQNFSGRISVMYFSDYLYANNGQADADNWLFIKNGLNNPSTVPGYGEMTMDRISNSRDAWYRHRSIDSNGKPSTILNTGTSAVRPVFYAAITKPFYGCGTINEPYVVYDAK